MILRMRESPWRLMLAVNVAVLIGVFFYKITREPYVPYIHLLVDYHFGFTKRALIGAVVSLFFAKVPVWLVFALSGAVWLITFGLFVKLFRRTFGFDDVHMPLFVFMAGSPFFLKISCIRSDISTSTAVRSRSACCCCRRARLFWCCSQPLHR